MVVFNIECYRAYIMIPILQNDVGSDNEKITILLKALP